MKYFFIIIIVLFSTVRYFSQGRMEINHGSRFLPRNKINQLAILCLYLAIPTFFPLNSEFHLANLFLVSVMELSNFLSCTFESQLFPSHHCEFIAKSKSNWKSISLQTSDCVCVWGGGVAITLFLGLP